MATEATTLAELGIPPEVAATEVVCVEMHCNNWKKEHNYGDAGCTFWLCVADELHSKRTVEDDLQWCATLVH